jgi:hypothetical protein
MINLIDGFFFHVQQLTYFNYSSTDCTKNVKFGTGTVHSGRLEIQLMIVLTPSSPTFHTLHAIHNMYIFSFKISESNIFIVRNVFDSVIIYVCIRFPFILIKHLIFLKLHLHLTNVKRNMVCQTFVEHSLNICRTFVKRLSNILSVQRTFVHNSVVCYMFTSSRDHVKLWRNCILKRRCWFFYNA